MKHASLSHLTVNHPSFNPLQHKHLRIPALIACMCVALSVQAESKHALEIKSEPLDKALNSLAKQSGVQILFASDIAAGQKSTALKGHLSAKEALMKMLEGTHLVAKEQADGTFIIVKEPETSIQADTLPEVAVSADLEKETATSRVKGYVAKRSATGTKTDTAIIETPRSIAVVTQDQMTAQGVQSVEQGLRYTAGVLTEFTGQDLRYQSVKVRGFNPQMYRDGLKVFVSGGYSDWLVDPQGVERIEVLKGPASVMYGQGSPAGIINQVSKRPQLKPVNQLGLQLGNYDRKQLTMDVGGSLNEDGTLLYRINGTARDSNTQIDHVQDDRLFIAPSLTWKISDQATLTVLAEATRDRADPKSWYSDFALIDHNPNGHISRKTYVGEPGFDHYDRDSQSLGYQFEYDFGEDWTLRQNMRYAHFKLDYQHVFGDTLDADMRTLQRGTLLSRTETDSVALDTMIQKVLYTGTFRHQVIFGTDYQRMRGRTFEGFGAAPALDMFNPIYGQAIATPDAPKYKEGVRQLGFYLQDQVKKDQWVFNLGLRKDQAISEYSDDSQSEHPRDSKVTGSAGAVYLFENGLAPYVSYATAFNPVINRTFDGKPFVPETAKQYEAGIKYQPNSRSLVTLSLFDLRQQNVTTADLANPFFSVQTGEIRSKGVELEGKSELMDGLNLIASYTYIDAEITKSNNPIELGKQPRQVARDVANAWLDYRVNGGFLNGWGAGIGVRYVSKVAANAANTRYNDPYTLVDAAIYYKQGPAAFSLNAMNLFDKEYTANFGNFYGQARTIMANFNYSW